MSELVLAFILLSLAIYRLALLLTREAGPFQIFHRLRIRLGAYDYDETGEVKTTLGQLFNCPFCMGIWLAAVATAILYFFPLLTLSGVWLVVIWLALAGAQSLLQRLHDGLEK